METDMWLIVLCALLYMLCGLIFCVAYIWNYRTDAGEANLGLMAFFWPLLLVFEVVMSLATQLGGITKKVASKRMHG